MFICKTCKSRRIKTRTNRLFGTKTVVTAARCKDCGSTEIESNKLDKRRGRNSNRFRKGSYKR